ncbi:LTA synthase family protein [Streptococcus pneumoniae]
MIYLGFYSLIFHDLNIVFGTKLELFNPFISIIGILFLVIARELYPSIKIGTIIHTGLLYICYLVFDYWMKMTFNLNVEAFHWEEFNKNHFMQNNGLLFTGIFLSLCLGYKIFQEYREKIYFAVRNRTYDVFLSQLFTYFIMTGSQMRLVIEQNTYLKIYHENGSLNQEHLVFYSLIAYILTSIFTYFFIQSCKAFKQRRGNFSLSVTTSILLAGIFNYTIQAGITDKGDWFGTYLASGATFFQIMVLSVLFIGVYGISNQYILGTIVNVALGIIVTIVNSLKFDLRHEPFLPADLSWWKEIGTVARFANIHIGFTITIVVLVVIAIIFFSHRFHVFSNKLFQHRLHQTVIILLVLSFFMSITNVVANSKTANQKRSIPIISSINNLENLHWLEIYFGLSANSRFQSLSYIWLKQLTRENMELPAHYSKGAIEELSEKYQNLAKSMNENRKSAISDQTVIYILSESFSDPRRLEGVQSQKEIIPNISQLLKERTSGLMKADGYGGATANMEFQTLTGLPKYNLSPYVSIMNSELAPNLTVFPSISNSFEDRVVIHLASGNNYSRRAMYSQLGFDTQIFLEENAKDRDIVNVGTYPSDESTYEKVLSELSTKKNQFFSVLTMQNHSPWYYYEPEDLVVTGENFTEVESSNLLSYSRLLYQTDQATKQFLDELSKIDKKITVVFYGDHLPGIYPQSAFSKNPDSQYLTDYFIWSNFETPKLDYPLVNSSDFTALMLEQTNSKVSPYYALLTEVLHKASVDKKELDKEGKEIAEDLKLIQYDLVAGKGYLSKEFFEIPQ